MRHLKAGRKLGRNAEHRLALQRNLVVALLRHERIITTVPKAKYVRPFVEKLITLAKKNTLHARRLVIARLGPMAKVDVSAPDAKESITALAKLFDVIGPRFADRPGGYTRVIKRHERRLGDAGETAYLEMLQAGERKVQKRQPPPAPAPKLAAEPAHVPAPAPALPTEKPAEPTPLTGENPQTPPSA